MQRGKNKAQARRRKPCAKCKRKSFLQRAGLVQLQGSVFARAKAGRQARLFRFDIPRITRPAIVELNNLPFLFTWETGGGTASLKGNFLDEVSMRKARTQKRVLFHTPFVEMVLDPNSPHSRGFLQALEAWRRKEFPQAKIQDVKSHYSDVTKFRHVVVIAPGHGVQRERWNYFEIPSSRIDYWMKTGRAFMAGVAKLAREYGKKVVRRK